MIKLAIVSPCYNEEEVLEESTTRLTALFDDLVAKKKISADSFVLFVNDGSKDRTWSIIKQLHRTNPYIKGMNLARNVGHQYAIMAGMMTAKDWSDAVITIDADLHNGIAQCKIILAQHIYETTMIWGDIPFTEAWVEGVKYPKFDSQEVVLNGVVSLLDEALNEINLDEPLAITDYDIFYKGDMQKWIRLAKSLKFRTLMTMVDKDPTKAEQIGKLISDGGMISSADDNLQFPYLQTAGNENPKYKILEKYTNGINIMFFANNNVLKPMQERNDSRISRYFEPGADGVYRGLDTRQAAEETDDENADLLSSVISKYLFRKEAPELIYSYQEQLFFEAEAYVRGLGVTSNLVKANELYKKAIQTACDYYEADPVKTTEFIDALDDLNTLEPDRALYEIHIQQWIDLMDRPLEEFVQWRRSGSNGNEVPVLTVPTEATSRELIRRWEYSPEEMTANPNAPKESPKIWEKMWFDL